MFELFNPNAIFQYLNEINLIYESHIIILVLFFSSTILFSLPIPGSIIVIMNIFILGFYGFFLTIIAELLSALIFYFFIRKLKIKKINLTRFAKYKNNIYILTLMRIIIPFPICTYIYTYLKIDFKYFFLSTFLGIIPGTLSITLIVSSLKKNLIGINNFSEIKIYSDPSFYFGILMIFAILLVSNLLKKKLDI